MCTLNNQFYTLISSLSLSSAPNLSKPVLGLESSQISRSFISRLFASHINSSIQTLFFFFFFQLSLSFSPPSFFLPLSLSSFFFQSVNLNGRLGLCLNLKALPFFYLKFLPLFLNHTFMPPFALLCQVKPLKDFMSIAFFFFFKLDIKLSV